MNKLVRAAVVGGAALAVGVLPAAGLASAATAPTPIPVSVSPSADPGAPTTSPTHAPTNRPVHHKTPTHGKTKRKHKGTGTGGTGAVGKGKGGKGGTGGTSKPGTHRTHRPSHNPVGHKPVSHRPVHKPVGHRPVHKPVVHPPVVHKPVGKPIVQPTQAVQAKTIVGGKNAGDSPWAVQVNWDDTGFECSGTAIAPQWVLTAGHCAGAGGMTVLIGSTELGKGTEATVDQKVVDPNGDMALLHLTDPVQTTYAQLADGDPTVGSIDQIYGFGKTDPNSGPSPELKTAKVKVTSIDCQDGAQGKAICSKGINGSAFNGDSGGPEMERDVQVGVCSTGDAASKTQEYASVTANREWIQQVANV